MLCDQFKLQMPHAHTNKADPMYTVLVPYYSSNVCPINFPPGSEVEERVFVVIKERLPLAAQQPASQR